MKSCVAIFVFALILSVSGQTSPDSYSRLRTLITKALEALAKVDELIESRRNSSEVIGKIIGQGYEKISQSSTVQKLANLNRGAYDRFVELTVNRFGVPQSDKEEIKDKVFGKLKDTEPGQWVEHKMLFNPVTDPENTKYICIYGYVRENLNFDIVILEVKASFSLAKNILIIHNKSTGKISLEEEELETERLPGGEVGKSDIQLLLKFFEATALRILNSKL